MDFWLNFYLGLIVYIQIILPSFIIAKQEIEIEGLFGWAALIFTKRYPSHHWLSRLYRLLTGKDKWATDYHLFSIVIWLLIYFQSLLLYPLYAALSHGFAWPAFWGITAIGLASYIMMITIEDYLWFVLNPYYGLKRFNKEYVPWVQNYAGGTRREYWYSFISSTALIIFTSWRTDNWQLLIIWLVGFTLTILTTYVGFKSIDKKIKRLPLNKYWWLDLTTLTIKRCPYAIESQTPDIIIEFH